MPAVEAVKVRSLWPAPSESSHCVEGSFHIKPSHWPDQRICPTLPHPDRRGPGRRPPRCPADQTLQELTDVRRRLAERITSPRWYRLGAAACIASMFIGMGVLVGRPEAGSSAESAAILLIEFGAILGPMALLAALKRSTGISIERYGEALGTWYAVVFGLLVLGFVLQAFAGAPFALPVAGVGAFVATVFTVFTERRIDDLLRRRVRDGAGVQACA